MNDSDLRLALRRACLRGDWPAAERIARRLGWRLISAALRHALSGLHAKRRRLRPR